MLPNKRYNFFFLNHLPILCKDTNYIQKYLWKLLKKQYLALFLREEFVCVNFTQYICSKKLIYHSLCTHTNIHILLLLQIV